MSDSNEISPHNSTVSSSDPQKPAHRLLTQNSPYLLQHADNLVEWHPWGEEAFEKAAREDKPIFLSIGYSSCHWCHVMEEHNFTDPEVAALMNKAFISVLVDREERPDLDNIYMIFSQALSGGGGWPMNIVMTPDKEPFFAATFIPKIGASNMAGMMDLIPRIQTVWENNRDQLLSNAAKIIAHIKDMEPESQEKEPGETEIKRTADQLISLFDKKHGGFGQAPKFPSPHNMIFLLRYWKETGDDKALLVAERTLKSMRRGGIYDHLGFGFYRYSTDAEWLVPHFEKMLYTQALMALAYTEVYQATGNERYAETLREIFTYVLRDMTSPEGGFYSAEDADSEGEEGLFYLWDRQELKEALDEKDFQFAVRVFNIEKEDRGIESKIMRRQKSISDLAEDMGLSVSDLKIKLERIRRELFLRREKRIHPGKDDKILTDWNGLMISALSKAAQALDEPEYARVAAKSADFILDNMRTRDGRLLHRYRNGEAAFNSHVDDYAFLIMGLLDLYEALFDIRYLKAALDLNRDFLSHFWDAESGAFYYTADDTEDLIVRTKEIYDGDMPSGNSVAALNLLRLAHITGDSSLAEKAGLMGKIFFEEISNSPAAHTQMMMALVFKNSRPFEVVIAGDFEAEDTKSMLKALRSAYIPNKVVLFRPEGETEAELTEIAEFTRYHRAIDSKATAYVCRNRTCRSPATGIGKMLESLNFNPESSPAD